MGYMPLMSRGPLTDHEYKTFCRLKAEGWHSTQIAHVLGRASGASLRKQIFNREQRNAATGPTVKPRPCMGCGATVQSEHVGHRMCDECRVQSASPFEPDDFTGLSLHDMDDEISKNTRRDRA